VPPVGLETMSLGGGQADRQFCAMASLAYAFVQCHRLSCRGGATNGEPVLSALLHGHKQGGAGVGLGRGWGGGGGAARGRGRRGQSGSEVPGRRLGQTPGRHLAGVPQACALQQIRCGEPWMGSLPTWCHALLGLVDTV
jgi:hypothetical protein